MHGPPLIHSTSAFAPQEKSYVYLGWGAREIRKFAANGIDIAQLQPVLVVLPHKFTSSFSVLQLPSLNASVPLRPSLPDNDT